MIGLIPLKFDQKFSLKSLSVDCSIRNLLVSCTSEFVYKNDENEDIEALFSFPLDNNCVVYYLEAVIGNKTIIGICKEIEEAKNLYKVAKEMGHMAALIKQHTSMSDVFKCRIGNFPKNSEAKIIIKFAMELKLSLVRSEVEGVDRMNLALPLILRPRYTPSGYLGDAEVFQVNNKYEYHFKASIAGTKVLSDVTSVNYSLSINYTNANKTCAQVALQSEYDGTKDLDINIDYVAMRTPTVFYELGTGSKRYSGKKIDGAFYQPDVAMVNFLPKVENEVNENQQKKEIIFIVDRSGSMGGSNIERAKECLLIFLKSLPMDCKFQIYGFGNTFDKAFNDSQLYSDQSITIALNYQKTMDADLGGTELMQPLQDMYNSPVASDYIRIVFLLTDGDVGNQDEVTRLVRKHNKTTRLFTVGIGDGVSTSLVDKVAKAGLGKSAFVRNAKELSASVMELLGVAINSNPFTDTKIKWQCPPHVSIVTVPDSIPPIFSDYFLTIFCMITGMKPNDVIHCTLSGNVNGKSISYTMDISDVDAYVDEEFRVHRLLAKYKIDEMTAQIENGQEDIKPVLIKLSTEINIVTNWTTFVAIDQDAPETGLITCTEQVNYGSFQNCFAYSMCSMPCPAPPPPFARACQLNFTSPNSFLAGAGYDSVDGRMDDMAYYGIESEEMMDMSTGSSPICAKPFQGGGVSDTDPITSKPNKLIKLSADVGLYEEEKILKDLPEIVDIIMFLAEKQNINGSWNFDESILVKIGLDLSKWKNAKPDSIREEVWITVVVYQYLTIKEQSRVKEWRLFANKTKQWIDKNLNDPSLVTSLFKISSELFS